MSSWFCSLGFVGGGITCARRILQRCGLRSPRLGDDAFEPGPGRLLAEARTNIRHERGDLRIAHAVGKAWHDRAALAFDGTDAGDDDVGEVARIGTADGGA